MQRIHYLIDTPKHFIAMAMSKNMAAFGNVSSATVKNDARRRGAFVAHNERRYNPNAATPPENMQVTTPGKTPVVAIAYRES